jgi:Zn ribbon nucleic-acid-binding protein
MTKRRLAPATCEKSPTKLHVCDCWWENGHYYSTCRFCGHTKEEDATLGEGRQKLSAWPFKKVEAE